MPSNFSVMTWNLENLYLPGGQFGPKTQADYDRKLANLARTILAIAPDVIGVQEVGDAEALLALQNELNGLYPSLAISSKPDKRGIRVGLLSKLPLTNVVDIDQFPLEALNKIELTYKEKPSAESPVETTTMKDMGRGALKATVTIAGLDIHIVTAHLKSKLITYSGGRRSPSNENERAREAGAAVIRRTGEAVTLRVCVNNLITGNTNPVILLGDFNDGPEAVTTQILMGPADGSLARRDKGDDVRLYNLVEYIPPERRYSRIYKRKGEMIDHIMVSYELIFRRQFVDSFIEPIQSITESTEERRDEPFSDHAPVYARFELL